MRRPRARTVLFTLVSASLAILTSSCQGGKPHFPARGQVLVGGRPAEGAVVVFVPADDPAPEALKPSGTVQADGWYDLRTYDPQRRTLEEGAPAGQYVVTLSWTPENAKEASADHPDGAMEDRLRGRYSDPDSSQLRAEVKEAPNELPAIQLPATALRGGRR